MSESQQARLTDLFAANYNELFRRLARRLGSREFAQEVLQETYLRIDRISDVAVVQSPRDYFFKAAVNVAKNQRKYENCRPRAGAVDEFFDIPDEAPDALRVLEARSEVEALKAALQELPERRRFVLEAMAIEGCSAPVVAKRLKISSRTVEVELAAALEFCATRLNRELPRRLGGPRFKI
ncbi:RNA polymerase sigma factor [Methyloferula stellata]|uniref:RNA polymerase sigma factor n=1 Tax=Methyloferula stellata TaxID=876270 RepID=UPI000376182A|nr:RNA polymerase sigma factor [Methyloferula stellata]